MFLDDLDQQIDADTAGAVGVAGDAAVVIDYGAPVTQPAIGQTYMWYSGGLPSPVAVFAGQGDAVGAASRNLCKGFAELANLTMRKPKPVQADSNIRPFHVP